jgi:dTDP-glucose pyrophosphorylase
MQILIPMSGRGSRFTIEGYEKPKPLIEFFGKPMIEHVLENLGTEHTFTLCVLRSHYDSDPDLFARLGKTVAQLNLVFVDKLTQGAAETCLLARKFIKANEPLMIANCDQLQESWDPISFETWFIESELNGCIFTFFKNDPAYSYVEIDTNNLVTRTVEKQVISEHATTGIYVWSKGKDFVWAAEKMIADNVRVNSEFYVCPVFNWNIARGARIGIYNKIVHWPIGVPNDLKIFIEAHPNGIESY